MATLTALALWKLTFSNTEMLMTEHMGMQD